MKKDLFIFGNGEFAQIAKEYFTYDDQTHVRAFVVNRQYIKEAAIDGIPVFAYEDLDKHFTPGEVDAFVAIPASKFNTLRMKFYYELKSKGYHLRSYVSSKAFVWRNVEIGDNCFIFENNVVQPFVKIGNNVVLWSGNHIGHQTEISDHVFMTSHVVVSGYCKIGEQSFLGVNSTFNDKTGVAARCIVGSGSLVTKYLEESDSLYMGAPAKKVPGKNPADIPL